MNRTWWLLSLLLAFTWLSALLFMTLTYSNPITLNRQQILDSSFVVRGQFNEELTKLIVAEQWPLGAERESLKLLNAAKLNIEAGQEYLVPVLGMRDHYQVTPSPLKGKPLVYPASEEAITQLKKILSESVD